MTDPNRTPPNWPRLTIRINAADGTVDLAGNTVTVAGASLQDARLQAIDVATAHAVRIGRPLHAHAVDPDGTWSLVIHPDGQIETTESDHKGRRLLYRVMVATVVTICLLAAAVGADLVGRLN